MVRTRRSGDPTFDGDGSSSAMSCVDTMEMGLSGDREEDKGVKYGGQGEIFLYL